MLSAEKAYERRWYTLAVLCMSLVDHHDRQLDPQRRAPHDRARPRRQRLRPAVDHRRLRHRVREPVAHRGRARRQVRPQGRADVRPPPLRRVLGARVAGDHARDADRRARAHGHRRRVHLPDHAVDPHQHLHRARAGQGHRGVGGGLGDRRRARPDARRDPGRALLLGLGVLRERADLRVGARARVLLHPDVARPRQPTARPRRRAALHPHPGRAALLDHPGPREGLDGARGRGAVLRRVGAPRAVRAGGRCTPRSR